MALPELPLIEQIPLIYKYGFDAIDIRMRENDSGEVPPDALPEELEKIRAIMPVGALSSVLCYNKQLNSGVSEMADSITKHLKIARALAAPAIRIFTGRFTNADESKVCQALETAMSREPEGKILIQNHLNCGPSAHQAIDICRTMGSERIGIAFSPDHCLLAGETIPFDEIAPYVKQLYIAGDEKRNTGAPPQESTQCYLDILERLKRADNTSIITFKWERCWKPELADYKRAFPQFLKWLNEIN